MQTLFASSVCCPDGVPSLPYLYYVISAKSRPLCAETSHALSNTLLGIARCCNRSTGTKTSRFLMLWPWRWKCDMKLPFDPYLWLAQRPRLAFIKLSLVLVFKYGIIDRIVTTHFLSYLSLVSTPFHLYLCFVSYTGYSRVSLRPSVS